LVSETQTAHPDGPDDQYTLGLRDPDPETQTGSPAKTEFRLTKLNFIL